MMRWRWSGRSRRQPDAEEDALWPRALTAGRTGATSATLLLFILSVTLDDLRMFRFPTVFVGCGIAIAVFAFAPPVIATRLVRRALADRRDTARTWMENAILRRRAGLVLSVAFLIMWLVFFSSGRTPRW